MCVLPSDSWTCDTLSMESSVITNKYDTPELINLNETSYLGLTEDPSNFSELVDSSYTTDSIPDAFNQETATPYPLIEFEETTENKYEKNINNTLGTNNEKYGYLQNKNQTKQEYLMLNQLIQHLLIYKKITIPLEILASMSLPTPLKNNTSKDTWPKEPQFSKTSQPSILMTYLVQNCIQQNNLQTSTTADTKLQSATEAGETLNEDNTNKSISNIETLNNTLQTLVDNLEDENNIILITDDTGDKQYLTIERYKLLGYQLDSQFISILPCVKNVRMPNATNCHKYYVCNPEIISVIEYSCPSNTAFNKFARVCDRESYAKCLENNQKNKERSQVINLSQRNMLKNNICTGHGKIRDDTSESHYYICYSSSDNLQNFKSIRIMCPNGLIFCPNNKVCTMKRLCKAKL